MNTKKIVLTALFVSIGIVLPQSFHMFGGSNLGTILSPMHIPVFIGAMLLGPASGVIIAITSVLSGMMFGMPPMLIGIFMMFELCTYAIISGYLYNKLKWNVLLTFIIAKVSGMAISLLVIQIMITFLGVSFPAIFGTFSMFIVSIPGIIIQTVLIPPTVLILKTYLKNNKSLT